MEVKANFYLNLNSIFTPVSDRTEDWKGLRTKQKVAAYF